MNHSFQVANCHNLIFKLLVGTRLVFLFFTLLFIAPIHADNIDFNKQIIVGGAEKEMNIYLSDLLNTNGISPSRGLFQKIKVTSVASKSETTMSRGELIEKLKNIKKRHPQLGLTNFRIPSSLKIIHKGMVLDETVVAWSLRKKWKSQCSSCQFVLEKITLPDISEEYMNQPWYLQASDSLPKGRFSVQIIFPKVINPSSHWVTGQAQTKKLTLVAQRNIEKGRQLNHEWLGLEYKNIEQMRGGVLDLKELTHKITNKYMVAGEVLKNSYLTEKILFNRGDAVKIVYENNGFQITTQGVAQAVGKMGKPVWVKNLNSNKRVSGIVSVEGEVIVQ